MGFREKNREGVQEMRENSRETVDIGSDMAEKAEQIQALLESIELLDEEDVQAVRETGEVYGQSFDSAFSEQVESAGQEIEQQGEQVRGETEGELENVRSGINKLEQAGGISDIGRDAAAEGRSRLEGSASEYEDIIAEAEAVENEMKAQIEALKSVLDGLFD